MSSAYDFTAETLEGKPAPLADHRGEVMLIVNTASKCGFTPQYAGLEALYRKYKDRGFVILGFPCNQFGAQEPGNAEEIASFCSLTYDVSFPMMRKIDVNGPAAHPLYQGQGHPSHRPPADHVRGERPQVPVQHGGVGPLEPQALQR